MMDEAFKRELQTVFDGIDVAEFHKLGECAGAMWVALTTTGVPQEESTFIVSSYLDSMLEAERHGGQV